MAETDCKTCTYLREELGEHCGYCQRFDHYVESGWHVEARLGAKIAALEQEVAELKGRLGKEKG